MATEPLETASGHEFPYCQQISVFLENRLGQLLRLSRVLDGDEVSILALSVEGSVDCAIVRLLVDNPDTALERLSDAGFAVTTTDVLVVELPVGKRGLIQVCTALIGGEININYTYPVLPTQKHSEPRLAIQVDNLASAAKVLLARKFRVLDQTEL